MDKGDSFSTTGNDEEFEEIIYTAPELRFSAILDISFFTKTRNNVLMFGAKIQSTPGLPAWLGIIFSITSIIQIILSSLLINSLDIWPSDHILSKIMRVLGILIDDFPVSSQKYRVLFSFILALFYLICLLLLLFHSFSYSKGKTISKITISFYTLFLKYIFVVFCPLLLAGFPFAFYRISKRTHKAIDILTVILVPIAFIGFEVLYYSLIKTRALLENTPFHEWLPLIPVREIPVAVCSAISTFIGFVSNLKKESFIFLPFLNFIIYGACGFYVIYYSNYAKQMYVLFLSSSFFTSSVISIFQIINLLVGPINPYYILLLIALVFLISFLIMFIFQRRRILSMLLFFDNCMEFPGRCRSLMDQEFPTPSSFLRKIIPVIDQWHPFFVEWKFFDYAIIKWPQNFDIALLYARVLSLFPHDNTFNWICSYILKLDNSLSPAYYVQFRQILQERQKVTSPHLIKSIDDIKSRIYFLITLIRRFWENVLQKNFANFWADVDKVTLKINEIELSIIQLTEDYPNNVDVFVLYYQFLKHIKHDFKYAQKISEKINLITTRGYQKADTAMSLAYDMFTNIRPYLESIHEFHDNSNENAYNNDTFALSNINNHLKLTTNTNTNLSSNSNFGTQYSVLDKLDKLESMENEPEEIENYQRFQSALSELTDHTKLGRISIVLIVCTIMTVIVIVVFFIFSQFYIRNFVEKQEEIMEYMSAFGLFKYRLNYLNLYMSMYSLFLSDKIVLNQNTMYTVAPNLYTRCHDLPRWSFSPKKIESEIQSTNDALNLMLFALNKLDGSNKVSNKLQHLTFSTPIFEGLTFQPTISFLFDICYEMIKIESIDEYFLEYLPYKFDPLFEIVNPYIEEITNETFRYSLNEYDKSMVEMTMLLIAVVFIALVLVSIPFTFQVFGLQNESNSISDSFSYFPNNAIRATITKYGISSSKKEDDSTYIAKVSHNPSYFSDYFKLFMTFLATFFPVTFCCILMHFIAIEFKDESKNSSVKIWTLHEPFSELVMSLQYSVLVAFSDVLDFGSIYRDTYARSIGDSVSKAEAIFSHGMYGKVNSIDNYYTGNCNMNFFNSCFPIDQIPQEKSLFEVLATDDFPISNSLVCASLKCLSARLLYQKMEIGDPELLSLFFYFTDFAEEHRTSIYFNIVEQNAKKKVSDYRLKQYIIMIIVIVFQCLSLVFIILILISKHKQIRNSLRFYHDLLPRTVTQNQHAVVLLSTGIVQDENSKTLFSNADTILSKVPLGIVLIDRQLIVTDVNFAFLKITQCENKDISRKPITDIIHRAVKEQPQKKSEEIFNLNKIDNIIPENSDRLEDKSDNEDRRSWPDFIQHITDSLNGHYPTNFTSKVTVTVGDDSTVQSHFVCNAICLTAERPAVDGEQELIEKVAIVINDISEDVRKFQEISAKQKKLIEMISNVIPKKITNKLLKTNEGISFVCQSLTVGEIEFSYSMSFDYQTRDVFSFLNDLSNECDSIISNYDLLCKVDSNSQRYIFVGGLFNKLSKPEKHAEQAVNFALKVIKEISDKYDTQVSVKVGIQTGGPVVAGVISINRPNLHIIGPAMDSANELVESCTKNQIHISLSVYELIFSSGFNVVEKRNLLGKDGNSIATYSIM